MTERQKQAAFLKVLLAREASDERLQWLEQINRAERDEKRIKAAMGLVVLGGLLCGSGLGYEAVLVPDFFQNPSHLGTRFFGDLGFACVICWVLFFVYWLWHRALTNRLLADCRQLLLRALAVPHEVTSLALARLPSKSSPPAAES